MLGSWATSQKALADLHTIFIENTPFPHVLIENFFDLDIANDLSDLFPDHMYQTDQTDQTDLSWKCYNNPLEYKYAHNTIDTLPQSFKNVFTLLQGPVFMDLMKQITGIKNLENDPYLHGAGLHFYPNKGKLDLHLDYSLHPITRKERRVNLIIYINKNFKSTWGGDLELRHPLDRSMKKRIQPTFNSAALFQTSDISIHGVPEEINCPVGEGRKSIAIYYVSEPRSDMIVRHKAEFLEDPTEDPEINAKKDRLRKIRKDRLITKEDLAEIWPEWQPPY